MITTCFKSILKISHSNYKSNFTVIFTREIRHLLERLQKIFSYKSLRLRNLKTRTAMNANILVFVICVEGIMYLLLYNLDGCTLSFNLKSIIHLTRVFKSSSQIKRNPEQHKCQSNKCSSPVRFQTTNIILTADNY